MGNKLIIQNADFSANALDNTGVITSWYIDKRNEAFNFRLANTLDTQQYWGDYNQSAIIGKSVNIIRLHLPAISGVSPTANNCSLYKRSSDGTMTELLNFDVTSGDISTGFKDITFPSIILQSGELLLCGISSTPTTSRTFVGNYQSSLTGLNGLIGCSEAGVLNDIYDRNTTDFGYSIGFNS